LLPPSGRKKTEAKVEVKSTRHRRDCRGEACLARRVRSTRITDVAIIHSKTSLSVIAGEACLAAYGGGSITACHGAPLQPQCYLKIRSAHFTGEACLARIENIDNQ
ncbi:MAG: hypothetical protein ACFNO7_08435, partial [Bacteroides sp.]